MTQLHDAFAKLDADSRDNLVLRDIEGLSGEDTAAKRLNLPAMKTRLRRARLAVRANVLQRQAKSSGTIA